MTESTRLRKMQEILDRNGVTFEVKFVPQHKERYDHDLMVSWEVALRAGDCQLESPYSYGLGHIEEFNEEFRRSRGRVTLRLEAFVLNMLKTGRWDGKRRLDPPRLPSVINTLIGDGVAYTLTHEEWCDYWEIDPDSIKGMETFRTCQHIGLMLTRMLGDDYREMAELFEDY